MLYAEVFVVSVASYLGALYSSHADGSHLTIAAAHTAPSRRRRAGSHAAQAEGLKVSDVVVLIDRQQGGAARMASNGLRLHSAFTLTFILDVLVRMPLCPTETTPLVHSSRGALAWCGVMPGVRHHTLLRAAELP